MSNITQEQWEKACKRAGINARSGPMHVAHRRSDMPPIGDPATVLAMLDWLLGFGKILTFEQCDGFVEIELSGSSENGIGDILTHGLTRLDVIVLAVLALP